MTSFASASLGLLHRLLGGRPAGRPAEEEATVLAGTPAVMAVEARICEATASGEPAGDGASRQAAAPGGAEWAQCHLNTRTGRESLAAAIGLSASGQRACTLLTGPELATVGDLLAEAAGQRLPLVVHVTGQALKRQALAVGDGHEALHAVADSGCVVMVAGNVQEAVDLSVIGRWVAERSLIPVLIAQDGRRTAAAPQDVVLPGDALLHQLLGSPLDRNVEVAFAQQPLQGKTRRRVPRRFDLDHPMLLTPPQGATAWGLAAAANEVYARHDVSARLKQAFTLFEQTTGRQYAALRRHRLKDAQVVLVAQGATVETAIAVSDACRREHGTRSGVLGIRTLRPLAAQELAEALQGAGTVVVLENVFGSLESDGPLLREVRAALHRNTETRRGQKQPRCVGVTLRSDGVRASDLQALLREVAESTREHAYLGLPFATDSAYPKRQALLDGLRRDDTDLEARSICGAGRPPDVRPRAALTLALDRPKGTPNEAFVGACGGLLHACHSGAVRTRTGHSWDRAGERCIDVLTIADKTLLDPGEDVVADIGVLLGEPEDGGAALGRRLRAGGILLSVSPRIDRLHLDAELLRRVQEEEIAVFHTPLAGGGTAAAQSEQAREALLGGVAAVAQRAHPADTPAAQWERARGSLLAAVPAEEADHCKALYNAARAATVAVDRSRLRPAPAVPAARETPAVLRDRPLDAQTDLLARFWDHVGVLYHDDRTAELTADPIMAAGSIPPLSAALRRKNAAPARLALFDAPTCTGNGNLWTCCPDGSVAAVAISVRHLLNTGIEQAEAYDLQPLAGPIAKAAHAGIARCVSWSGTAEKLLRDAFREVAEARGLEPKRHELLSRCLETVLAGIGALHLARTRPFFDEAEAAKRGSGELLTAAVDPDVCRCPDLLLHVGRGRGFVEAEATPENIEAARIQARLLERLPETRAETIARVSAQAEVGELAAALLSHSCRYSLVAGGSAEAGSGASLVLRHVLALSEYHLRPRWEAWLEEIASLRTRLAEEIRSVLSESLPTGDLDALADGLNALGRSDVPLASLSERVERVVQGGHVDGARLARLVDCARGLADLQWHLTGPANGLRRSRFGLVIAADSIVLQSCVFPYNPFGVPAALAGGAEVGATALGLLDGQIRQLVAAVRLLRWARLELDRPADAIEAAAALARLQLNDLLEEERQLCPPLLVVGDERSLARGGLGQLAWLLDSHLPLKFILLGEPGIGAEPVRVGVGQSAADDGRSDELIAALLGGEAFVAQTSPAAPAHLAESLRQALHDRGAALIRIHAPSPARDGFRPEHLFSRMQSAVATRAFPLLRFVPAGADGSPGGLDLSGNAAPKEDWARNTDGKLCTPADWAVHEPRFARWFGPLSPDAAEPTRLTDFLAMSREARKSRTPMIDALREGTTQHLQVGGEMVAAVDRCLKTWRMLRERAGLLASSVAGAAGDNSDAAVDPDTLVQLRADYEQRMLEREHAWTREATERVTDRLLALAGYGTGRSPAAAGTKEDAR